MHMIHRSHAQPHQVLDTRTLGRPVHLLDVFTKRFKADLTELFVAAFNRRYRADFQLDGVRMRSVTQADRDTRWSTWRSDVGRIGFAIDHALLLTVLHHRYGLPGKVQLPEIESPSRAHTVTEARLVSLLAQQLLKLLARRIDAASAVIEDDAFEHEFVAVNGAAWPGGEWVLEIELLEPTHEVYGVMRFCLDQAWFALLLQRLVPVKEKAAIAQARQPSPVSRLPVTLTARLVEKDMALGQLFDLHVGDVIPIHLGAAKVLVNEARLFEAVVAEHKGKLCLTSFEDTE